jgi:hypothetical protein
MCTVDHMCTPRPGEGRCFVCGAPSGLSRPRPRIASDDALARSRWYLDQGTPVEHRDRSYAYHPEQDPLSIDEREAWER